MPTLNKYRHAVNMAQLRAHLALKISGIGISLDPQKLNATIKEQVRDLEKFLHGYRERADQLNHSQQPAQQKLRTECASIASELNQTDKQLAYTEEQLASLLKRPQQVADATKIAAFEDQAAVIKGSGAPTLGSKDAEGGKS